MRQRRASTSLRTVAAMFRLAVEAVKLAARAVLWRFSVLARRVSLRAGGYPMGKRRSSKRRGKTGAERAEGGRYAEAYAEVLQEIERVMREGGYSRKMIAAAKRLWRDYVDACAPRVLSPKLHAAAVEYLLTRLHDMDEPFQYVIGPRYGVSASAISGTYLRIVKAFQLYVRDKRYYTGTKEPPKGLQIPPRPQVRPGWADVFDIPDWMLEPTPVPKRKRKKQRGRR